MPYRPVACLALLLGLSAAANAETTADTGSYRARGEAALQQLKAAPAPQVRARNVIVFIGDGMGVSTLTAARIFAGQGQGADGESFQTAMDGLEYTALVKTYSHDAQVADSAPTATAILSGVKTRNGVIGIGPEATLDDCASGKSHHVPSLLALAQARGLATGVVTTTRITHATPAATYAHTVQRDWESDFDVPQAAKDQGCVDIARQMIEGEVGSRLDVIMGGGRAAFMPIETKDPEYAGKAGLRRDRRDLLKAWRKANPKGLYVWNRAQMAAFDPAKQTRLLGLFEPDHMQYEADRAKDGAGEPALAEMVETAIKALQAKGEGYVLLVEGGRIDHAHHAGNAHRALADAQALDEAIAAALKLVDLKETLVISTADHSHTLTINGYPMRGNPILGTVAEAPGEPTLAKDGKAYTTLSYANGPGAVHGHERPDPAVADSVSLEYRQQALVPLASETHGGEDVVVRASGPGAQLVRGTIEQNTIYYIMREALFGPSSQ
ncbi:MAG: alkaline phosphatase [Novosphingobium sp.]